MARQATMSTTFPSPTTGLPITAATVTTAITLRFASCSPSSTITSIRRRPVRPIPRQPPRLAPARMVMSQTPQGDAACAQVLENISSAQAQKDAACGALTDKLKTGMACFRNKLSGLSPAIPLKVTSDIRDVAYQVHLSEIWDKMEDLVELEDDPVKRVACATRRAEIAAEKGCDNADVCTSCYDESATQRSHCLIGRPANPNPNDAQHTQGNAFDVSRISTINP